MFRKGSVLVRQEPVNESTTEKRGGETASSDIGESGVADLFMTPEAEHAKEKRKKEKKQRPYEGLVGPVVVLHEDIIKDTFWLARPWLLA